MVLGRASDHPEGHRFVGGVSRAATQHHQLCVGDLDQMRTDSRALLEAGVEVSVAMWTEAAETFAWSDLDRYIIHQVSNVHTSAITAASGHRSAAGADDVSDIRQHRPGLHPLHPGPRGR